MRAMRKLFAAVLGAVLVAALFALANPTPANAADGGAEAQFVSAINNLRASKGLGPVAVYGELTGVARDWSDTMAANGGISHNPNLSGAVSANWSKLGENVGVGGSVSSLMTAFINSPAHYKNLVDPAFNYIGVGVSYGADGRMYTTHDFMALNDGSGGGGSDAGSDEPAPAPAPKHRSAPAPAPEPEPEAAAPAEPVGPPPPPATPVRVKTVLTALRVVGN